MKIFLPLLFLLGFIYNSFSQNSFHYSNFGNSYQYNNVAQVGDSIIIIGSSIDNNGNTTSIISFADSLGEENYTKVYFDSMNQKFSFEKIILLRNSTNSIIVGKIWEINGWSAFVMKIDKNGKVLNAKKYHLTLVQWM